MAYFSNGSEGCDYNEHYCLHCIHWKDLNDGRGEGCPVWDVHLAWMGRALNEEGETNDIGEMLNTLIPEINGRPGECLMFVTTELLH